MLEKLKHFDYLLAITVTALSVFGIVMIFAATNTGFMPKLEGEYKSQILYVASGFVLMVALAFIDYRFITKFYIPIYILCIGLLAVALLLGWNDTDPARWIFIPIPGYGDISIQPSEFAKIFMILVLAKFIELRRENFNHILMLLLILVGIALPVALIGLQPSLSAMLVVFTISMIVLFTGGLRYRTILIALLIIIPVAIVGALDLMREEPLLVKYEIIAGYQFERIQTFLNPVPGSDEYMQMEASLFAIGSGGLYGKGFRNVSYVPNQHNDFIFATVAEQFGFVGCMILLGLMAFVIVKCILTALRAEDLQGRLIAAGVAGMLLFETFVNVGVVTELLPLTGIAFPFLSAGGSIVWVHMAAMGLVLNVAMGDASKNKKRMFGEDL